MATNISSTNPNSKGVRNRRRIERQIDLASDLARTLEKAMLSYPYAVRVKALRAVSAQLGFRLIGLSDQMLVRPSPAMQASGSPPVQTRTNKVPNEGIPSSVSARDSQKSVKPISWTKTEEGARILDSIRDTSKKIKETTDPEVLTELLEDLKKLKTERDRIKNTVVSAKRKPQRVRPSSSKATKTKTRRKDPSKTLEFTDKGNVAWTSITYRNLDAALAANRSSKKKAPNSVHSQVGNSGNEISDTSKRSKREDPQNELSVKPKAYEKSGESCTPMEPSSLGEKASKKLPPNKISPCQPKRT